MIAVQTLVRGWVCLRGWFYIDDFSFTGRSTHFPLASAAYLLEPYNSHVMPGSYAWVWLTTKAFPLQWAPVAVVMLLLQLLLSVLVLTLLVELFGLRPSILPALAVAVLSPISLPASVWWAAALNQLPQQIAIVTGVLALVRWQRAHRWRHVVLGPLALGFGLLFSEKSLFLLPLLAGLALAAFTSGSILGRLRQSLGRDRLLWAAYGPVALPYFAWYVTAVPSPLRTVAAGHDITELATTSLSRATVPGLLGGPWQWMKIGYAGGVADPGTFVVGVSLLVAAAVIGGSVWMWRGGARYWWLLAGYAALNLALLARSRATVVGPVVGLEYRYQSDLAIVAALCLALATIPLAGRVVDEHVDRLRQRESSRATLARALTLLRAAGVLGGRTRPGVAAAVASAALVLSSVWSTLAYAPLWHENPARPWLDRVRVELAGMPKGVALADTAAPQEVAWGYISPWNHTRNLLAPVLTRGQLLGPGGSASTVVVPDDEGHLRRALIGGPRVAPGPTTRCGWDLGRKDLRIPVPDSTVDAPVIRIGYLATADTRLDLVVNGVVTPVDVRAGLGAAHVTTNGRLRSLVVRRNPDNARVCSDEIVVGTPAAVAGTSP